MLNWVKEGILQGLSWVRKVFFKGLSGLGRYSSGVELG